MGGGNGQKSRMAREKHMEKNKPTKGSQLESNKKAMTIQGSTKLHDPIEGSSWNIEFPQNGDAMSVTRASRKLKGNGYDPTGVDLEDYRHRIDPVPSSKASIKPGPIEHGTPLNPFIPKPPSPPNHPKSDNGST
ncbi:hypothetical protein CXB51_015359 [Gossypium anomalum]|uniref:Small EDRK-rich factor-like N-terminal domain-containing protein n=1 Tax=Gossypium anomalum TaxID=47600 RepID=A0A8J5YSJ7_9ROSI|nr:hypothetical protein CXB51_015359 [Gossypium anomalum]